MTDGSISWDEFVRQSPWLHPAEPTELDKRISSIDYFSFNTTDKFKEFDIYINEFQFFFHSEKRLIHYEFISLVDEGVKLEVIWCNNDYSIGYESDILVKYFLPKFKSIESSTSLGEKGFSIWKNMILRFPENNYYGKHNGKLKELNHPLDVYFYKGDLLDRDYSIFVAKIKE